MGMDRFVHVSCELTGIHSVPSGKPRLCRLTLGAATCMIAAMTVGCGAEPSPAGTVTPTASPAVTGLPAGCQNAVSAERAGTVLTITLAGNNRIYCVRVGDTLRLTLPSTGADPWQSPLITGTALKPIPGAGSAVTNGITGATYEAVGPGQVDLVSVRPPCQIAFAPQKGDAQPRSRTVRLSPGRSCSPGRFFSTSVDVMR
jgi:hypothetical protein